MKLASLGLGLVLFRIIEFAKQNEMFREQKFNIKYLRQKSIQNMYNCFGQEKFVIVSAREHLQKTFRTLQIVSGVHCIKNSNVLG